MPKSLVVLPLTSYVPDAVTHLYEHTIIPTNLLSIFSHLIITLQFSIIKMNSGNFSNIPNALGVREPIPPKFRRETFLEQGTQSRFIWGMKIYGVCVRFQRCRGL